MIRENALGMDCGSGKEMEDWACIVLGSYKSIWLVNPAAPFIYLAIGQS